jgi:hypothetical protein
MLDAWIIDQLIQQEDKLKESSEDNRIYIPIPVYIPTEEIEEEKDSSIIKIDL